MQAEDENSHSKQGDARHGSTSVSVDLEVKYKNNLQILLEPGQVIANRFRIIELIGCGGMGAVYKVMASESGTVLALKTIHSKVITPEGMERFLKEAKTANSLDNPGLIAVREFGLIDQERPFLVMDFVEGGSLLDEIKRAKRLSVNAVLNLFMQVCDTLAYVHAKGVVHRDLKPSNLLLGQNGVKIADFGIAWIAEDDSGSWLRLTHTGDLFGTPLYMSPEQCAGKRADNRSDIYSVGCTMYEALTGRPPFLGESYLSVIAQHQNEMPPTLAVSFPGAAFPAALESFIAKALAKDPAHRFQKMEEASLALGAIKELLEKGPPPSARILDMVAQLSKSVSLSTALKIALCGALISSLGTVYISHLLSEPKASPAGMKPPDAEFERDSSRLTREASNDSGHGDQKKWATTILADRRIFHFPTTFSMGNVSVAIANGVWSPAGSAIGTRSFPRTAVVKLEPSWAVCTEPELLDRFAPDDFAELDFMNSPLDDTGLKHVRRFTALTSLILGSTDVTDFGLGYILDMPHLESLSLSNTSVTSAGVMSLKRMKHLKGLWLCHMSMDATKRAFLKDAKNLDSLSLRNTRLINDDLATFSGLTNLSSLDLDDNPKITDEGLQHLVNLKKIRFLDVSRCSVTADSLRVLRKLPVLSVLTIKSANWSESDIEKFYAALPKCRIQ